MENALKEILTPLLRYCFALTGAEADAHDLMQETVLRAIVHKQKFMNIVNRKSWMFKVALNLYRDRHRKETRHKLQQMSGDVIGNCLEPSDNLQLGEKRNSIMLHFEKLPPVQRQIMYLRCVEEFSLNEIAGHLETSVSNVKANLSIARKKLRRFLQHERAEADK